MPALMPALCRNNWKRKPILLIMPALCKEKNILGGSGGLCASFFALFLFAGSLNKGYIYTVLYIEVESDC